jgi:CheY-like chemotaxis protein
MATSQSWTDQAPSAQGTWALPAAPASLGLVVLVVEDNEVVLRNTEAILSRLGHVPVATPCGEAAIQCLQAGLVPGLVILDLNMPGLGGVGTLPRLRALNPSVPIILVTAWVDAAARELAAAHPNVTLLAKPLNLKQLGTHLDQLGRKGLPALAHAYASWLEVTHALAAQRARARDLRRRS